MWRSWSCYLNIVASPPFVRFVVCRLLIWLKPSSHVIISSVKSATFFILSAFYKDTLIFLPKYSLELIHFHLIRTLNQFTSLIKMFWGLSKERELRGKQSRCDLRNSRRMLALNKKARDGTIIAHAKMTFSIIILESEWVPQEALCCF